MDQFKRQLFFSNDSVARDSRCIDTESSEVKDSKQSMAADYSKMSSAKKSQDLRTLSNKQKTSSFMVEEADEYEPMAGSVMTQLYDTKRNTSISNTRPKKQNTGFCGCFGFGTG